MSKSPIFVALMLLWGAGCSEVPPQAPPAPEPVKQTVEAPPAPEPIQVVVPPWRLYPAHSSGDPHLAVVDELMAKNRLSEALSEAESALQKNPASEELFARVLSLKLQFGRSREVLSHASRFAAERGMESLSAQTSLIIAFAYKHQHDIDQTLAWLGVVVRRGAGTQAAHVAGREIDNLLSRIVDSGLDQYALRWEQDLTVQPFFRRERERRLRGGVVVTGKEVDYFSPTTYGVESLAVSEQRELVPLVLVTPSEGRGAKLAEQYRRGFDLAREEFPSELKTEFVEEERALERLGVLSGLQVVVGPQLRKTFDELKSTLPQDVIFFPIGRQIEGAPRVFPLAVSKREEVSVLQRIASEGLKRRNPILLLPEGSQEVDFGIPTQSVSPGTRQLNLEGRDVVLSLLPGEDFTAIFQLLKETAPHLPVVAGPEAFDRPVVRSFVTAFEGVLIAVPFYPESERPVVKRFVSRYQSKYQESPTLGAAVSYDLTRLFLARIPQDGVNLLQSLGEMNDFESVIGLEGISSQLRRKFTVLQVRQGEFIERGTNYEALGQ